MRAASRFRTDRAGERGFTLAVVLTLVTVIAVIVAFTLPKQWSLVAKREREIQTVWVMKQYARGIAEFQRANGALPVSLEQIEKQKTPRVMRRMYPNPLSGEMDWILIPPEAANQPRNTNQPGTGMPTGNRNQPSRTAGRPSTGGSRAPGPFIGVRPPQTGSSIIALNGATTYESWLFTIQDLPNGGDVEPPKNPQQYNPQ